MDNRSRRILKELRDLENTPDQRDLENTPELTCKFRYGGEDFTHLTATFKGPRDTAYAGGTFHVHIDIPDNYPFKPPIMKMATKLWHPNISSVTGAICLDTIGSAWSPVMTITSTLLSLQSLLTTPEPNDPQDHEVAKMLKENPAQFQRVAREWAVKYAGAPQDLGFNTGAEETTAPSRQLTVEELAAKYEGYNKNLVDRFVNMGFDVEAVVAAFKFVGIDKNGGRDYEMEEAFMGDCVARLLNEP